MRAAQAVGALTMLEVNAPVIDYPGSTKRRIDRALLVEPMRRWRDWQCRHADLFVTPQGGHPAGVGATGSDRAPRVGRRHGAVHAGRGQHLWMLKAHLDDEDGALAEMEKAG